MLAPLLLLLAASTFQSDPVDRLGVWVARARLSPRSVDDKRLDELAAILGDLRVLRAGLDSDASALDLGLVGLASLEWREGSEPESALLASARLGRAEIEAELARRRAPLASLLAERVLAPEAKRPRAERLAAAALLTGLFEPVTLTTLVDAAHEEDEELAEAARTALCGWPTPSVHLYFLEELARGSAHAGLAARHFEGTASSLDGPLLERLRAEVARRYLADDWREAARARRLVRALDAPHAVPVLIEALATWLRRAQSGASSRRIRAEIVEELQRFSGRAIGPEPERWSDWWRGVREGRIALPGEVEAAGGQNSSAVFFGLHAATERVLFVVDRSGSMSKGFGTDGRSRYAEAIDQLLRFLQQSGTDTRFSVALFSDEGVVWRTRLTPATTANMQLAQRWLEGKDPEGETRLFQGLRAGLGLDGKGRVALERCEADTVIVLCDGATSEGPEWVARWLAQENERAQLVFHCVQIGPGGDGTLEALSQGTGGQFVRVQS